MDGLKMGKAVVYSLYSDKPMGGWWFIDSVTGAEESGFRTKAEAVACARRIRKNFSS